MDEEIHLAWHGPLSFFADQDVPCVFQDNIARTRCGVYLWTIEHHGSYLINYVGKVFSQDVNRTFTVRFREELADERHEGLKVDVDLFFQGRREKAPRHHDRLEEVQRAYRVFVAPLSRDLGDSGFKDIEGSLINAVKEAGDKYASFLYNGSSRKRFAGGLAMESADLLGLDGLVG